MATETHRFYRTYVLVVLTIGVILLAVLVGGLWYGSLRAKQAAASATRKVNSLSNQIKEINQNLQQVKNIDQGIQNLNNNVKQLNQELR